ncbi:DNA invertase Pin-like site-specific DNA recombinase [Larkinella arboricola]|uniref:DNA invertase Pin-like site-specific DNA recombinase n=1 Tax=Larkinella arboricola TaxID=643671 RepID=A0A327WLI4_LARAB|nr:recombinase family protein [Larkinella arboricola]RAJ90855.1 DNA invertase Pin-like site-specific DNA recombinase [Larkinella arboricola]
MKYVCYYRVSTKAQGRSGLGLGDQQTIVGRYLRETDEIIAELTEVESGKKSDRPKLVDAIRICQQQGAKLLIAKLDRLSRNVAFVMTLRDSGVDFVACDLPDANTLTVGMMVTFAQYEAERTSERTRAALAQKKSQGFPLGKPENLTREAIRKGEEIRRKNAATHKANVQATELALLYRTKGMTYTQIAEKLNQTHYQTRRNKSFDGKAVYRLLQRVR